MTSPSLRRVLAAALYPPPVDVFGAPGCGPAPKQQLVPSAAAFSVLIGGRAPRIC
jgi:hypothetical protein